MIHRIVLLLVVAAVLLPACQGTIDPGGEAPIDDELKQKVQAEYASTTDLVRLITAPTCAAQVNECHNSEDFPDQSTEGNLWNLVNLQCNVGVGERDTIDDFCEGLGDEMRITSGTYDGRVVRIGSITLIIDEDSGDFLYYEITVDDSSFTQNDSNVNFEFLRGGMVVASLGVGNSLEISAGSNVFRIFDDSDLDYPEEIRQGDENKNGIYGDGSGVIIRPGDARNSYMVRRLFGAETDRVRMPLNENSDNITEVNQILSAEKMYAIMSWINCMEPADGVYSPIRYDCEANADNDGVW